MRLDKIKLAGFKSFVDPTSVPLPSNLVAVVGPNGCGKSNVIDAVRWVMGESSAKMLRGESMADVIFNGSSARKPVGTATIELVFDNSDGGAGGQYAKYSQISVKRQVSRDGQSAYYLNGTRCRRRDITDLFLGTGLGPRSYSIIEQGTISRLIEARPEELRAFLEEAAGISKYKERRRETENRIRHTRENLDRLNDLVEEVGKHLQHLERQAATAERYKKLREQERRLKAELLALGWRDLSHDLAQRDKGIGTLETEVEAAVAGQRRLEADLERLRSELHETGDAFNEVQGRFYAVGGDIARTEQSLQYGRDARRRQEQELEQAQRELGNLDEQARHDSTRLEELEQQLLEQEPELERLGAEEEDRAAILDEAEAAMESWQGEWEAFNQGAAEPAQLAQVERTRINHLEQQIANLQRRKDKLAGELERLGHSELQLELEELAGRESAFLESRVEGEERLEAVNTRILDLRGERSELVLALDEVKEELQTARGRQASLEALQQADRAGQGERIEQWLEERGLHQAQRLADGLEVEPAWRNAVEVVLAERLQAVHAGSLAHHGGALDTLDEGPLHLFEGGVDADPAADELRARVRSPWSLRSWLHGVRVADDLPGALQRRGELAPGESFVTPDGIRIGPDWLQLPGQQQPGHGVLERAEELKALQTRVADLGAASAELGSRLQQQDDSLDALEAERADLQVELDRAGRELSRLHSDLSAKRTRLEHLVGRRESVEAEHEEVAGQILEDREAEAEARERLHQALEQMETLASRRDQLVAGRDRLRSAQEEARGGLRSVSERARKLALAVEAARTARQSLGAGRARLHEQLEQWRQRRDAQAQALETGDEPLRQLQEELERQLSLRIEVEQELAQARKRVEAVESGLRDGEQQRQGAERQTQERRANLDQARMARQEVVIRSRTLEEQLKETGMTPGALLAELEDDAREAHWREEVEKMAVRIQRLGAINLAAIDEFREESERKRYLDEQHADVTRSLETLEEAIRKIDRETRTRFKETFDRVNNGIKTLFPRLFGGGHAGVTVMARPPGKRNSSIHLLSGGEKALTAVALVFSIFQLNPSPFCMLDEVDAPLDDANVGRFCELVKSMSDQVQFIFITHNKITMELANQLCGVTMHEPGVSRLVSVDVEEAVQLAAV
jgi:chromosome segregation protein